MSEPRQGLKSLGLENAVRLRWVLRDIKGNRLKLSPPHPNDLRILVDMGFVEIQNDVPVITSAGLGLSPACHPAMGRVPMTFEPKGLGGATGRSAEPSV